MSQTLAEKARVERDSAVALVFGGRLEEAIARFQLSIVHARADGDDQAEGEAEFLLGQTYRRIGGIGWELDRLARRHVERAAVAFRRARDDIGCLEAFAFLALAAADVGDEANVRYALYRAEKLDPAVAEWWRSYTGALSAMGAPNVAAAAFRRCLKAVEVLPRSVEHWRRECELKLAFLMGDEPAALIGDRPTSGHPCDSGAGRTYSQGSRSVRAEHRDHLIRLITGAASGDNERALEAVDAAERSRLNIRSQAKQRELSATLGLFYTAAAVIADRSGRYRDAVDLLELNTSRSLTSRAATSWLWKQSPLQSFGIEQQTSVLLLESLWRRELEVMRGLDEQKGLNLALRRCEEAAHEVEEELVRLVPPPHRTFRPSTSSQLEARLAATDAVVLFAPFGAVYVLRDGQVERAAEVRPEAVEAAADTFVGAAAVPGAGSDSRLKSVTEELVAACVDPLREALVGARRVFVVPSKALWAVPLAALGAAPLGEQHRVSYVPSLSMLGFLLAETRGEPRRRVERFVGIANPDGSLPYAAEEVAAAGSHFDDPAVFVGGDIQFGAALHQVLDADIVHLACHGDFFAEFPDSSYIHVAGRGNDRNMLWARDLVRLSLRSRLVVLSVCHAGTTIALPGNEYVGLPVAFLHAGARTVVAPLWVVKDQPTWRFMAAFYDELDGASPAVALSRVQRRMRAEPPIAHPYDWAGFQTFGVP